MNVVGVKFLVLFEVRECCWVMKEWKVGDMVV